MGTGADSNPWSGLLVSGTSLSEAVVFSVSWISSAGVVGTLLSAVSEASSVGVVELWFSLTEIPSVSSGVLETSEAFLLQEHKRISDRNNVIVFFFHVVATVLSRSNINNLPDQFHRIFLHTRIHYKEHHFLSYSDLFQDRNR